MCCAATLGVRQEREGKEAPSPLNFDMIYFNSCPEKNSAVADKPLFGNGTDCRIL
jgi:hypothetical protein